MNKAKTNYFKVHTREADKEADIYLYGVIGQEKWYDDIVVFDFNVIKSNQVSNNQGFIPVEVDANLPF